MSNLITKEQIALYKQMPTYLDLNRIDQLITEAQKFDLKKALGDKLYFKFINNYGTENIVINYSNLLAGVFTIDEIVSGKVSATVVATGKVVSDAAGVLTISPLTGTWEIATTLLAGTSAATANVDSIEFGIYYQLFKGKTYTDPSDEELKIQYEGLIPCLAYWSYARLLEVQNITVTSTGVDRKNTNYSTKVDDIPMAKRITQARSGAIEYFEMVVKFISDMNYTSKVYPYFDCGLQPVKNASIKMITVDRFARESNSTIIPNQTIFPNNYI